MLMVDRGAGAYAGPRSASIGENSDQENNQRLKPVRSPHTANSPAA
jgi:hypothetical protein